MLPINKWQSPNGTDWQKASNSLDALTPGYSRWTSINNANAATIRSELINSRTLGMVATSKSSGTTDGVVSNHAYMIYDAYTVNGNWQVRLYNPWGIDTANGALDGSNDGLITLTWSQFTANFTGYVRNA